MREVLILLYSEGSVKLLIKLVIIASISVKRGSFTVVLNGLKINVGTKSVLLFKISSFPTYVILLVL